MERDAIDFGKTEITSLFIRLFVPTLLGLLLTAVVTLADGIFVGKGVGSDALAAINIAAPMFQVSMGISLMFASGVSIVAAVHLARDNVKAACINVTQAMAFATLLMLLVACVVYAFPTRLALLFGGSWRLMPYIVDYLFYVMPALVAGVPSVVGMFVIRLDGSPNFALAGIAFGSVLNIVLDWIFVFHLGLGIRGAALGTSIAVITGAGLMLYYMWFRATTLRFYRLKLSMKSLRLTIRNIGYMMRVGFPTFVGETAMLCMMVAGNYMFIGHLGEDGVAAFSVACYMFPLVFMLGSAVAQSAQPIVSYNYSTGDGQRIRRTLRLSLLVAIVGGLLTTLFGMFLCSPLIGLFLSPGTAAYEIAVGGFPLFALSFLFFTLNLVLIAYYQALERSRPATFFMSLRGYFFVVPVFLLLPRWLGDDGLWLAVPLSEFLTFCVILAFILLRPASVAGKR